MKERSDIEDVVTKGRSIKALKQLDEAKALQNEGDPEMAEMASAEISI